MSDIFNTCDVILAVLGIVGAAAGLGYIAGLSAELGRHAARKLINWCWHE